VYYIFHGDDEFSRTEKLAQLRHMLAEADGSMAELNTSILDGSTITWGELRHACDSVPFMSERRMVIVNGLLLHLKPNPRARGRTSAKARDPAWRRAFLKDLQDYLPTLPSTTRLLFVEDDSLQASHPILKFAVAEGRAKGAFVESFKAPKDPSGWIRRRAQSKGGALSREAVAMLADLVGDDLRLLDQEIEKLTLYADGQEVTVEDVRTLVSRAIETSIFDLVDCLGRNQTDRALGLLRRLLDERQEPLYVLAMLARQVRILIQVSELRAQGQTEPEIVRRLGLHPYPVKKAIAQAGHLRMAQLEAAHQLLIETDWAVKTGELEEPVALDLLVVELTRA
jgi:DNA polymerase-3 subunit delta